MKALISTSKRTERVFLIGAELKSRNTWEVQDSLSELAQLTTTAGAIIVGEGTQKLEAPVSATFIGSGKAEEWAETCRRKKVDTVIFDDELTAAQGRNLEETFKCKILDRTALILDIFAQRARTREGKLQVELAQLEHLLPRLTRFWGHLSRQKGGIGMRGEGETQLETDRRRVEERIHKINEELKFVRQQRTTQRMGRQRNLWPLASIVGYTNAGKSTLFNALTGASVLAEDKLFATLDPTTRRLRLETNQNVLLSDTVGFIRKLPHRLVEAFKATLEEVVQADLLLHVVDVSHPKAEAQIQAVNSVLDEIGAGGKPTLMVLNKIDLVENREMVTKFLHQHPQAVVVSAQTQEGFEVLKSELSLALRPIRRFVELALPHEATALMARLHTLGEVVEQDFTGDQTRLKVRLPPHALPEFSSYVVKEL